MKTSVIGVGRMGRRHLAVLRDLGLTINAVSDFSDEARQITTEEFGLAPDQVYQDAHTLLAEVQPELVVIATTAPAHQQLTLAAAMQGATHILCEKPMAVSIQQCDQMIATCQQHDVKLAINHYMRFIQMGQRLRALIGSEAFGELHTVTVSAANFGLAMVGTHFLELFQFLVDEPLVAVTAWLEADQLPNPRGPQFFDRAGSLRVVSASGKLFYLHAGLHQGHTAKMVLAGSYGQAVVDPYVGSLHISTRQPENRDQPTTRYVTPSVETHETLAAVDTVGGTRAVLQALLDDAGYPRGDTVRNVIATLVAAYVSDEAGQREIQVDDNLPFEREFPWA